MSTTGWPRFGAVRRVDVLRAVVFLVMLLGVADTLASGVVQRTRELASRARWVCGAAAPTHVLVEALVMGTLACLGSAVGIALGALWVTGRFVSVGLRAGFHVPTPSLGSSR